MIYAFVGLQYKFNFFNIIFPYYAKYFFIIFIHLSWNTTEYATYSFFRAEHYNFQRYVIEWLLILPRSVLSKTRIVFLDSLIKRMFSSI